MELLHSVLGLVWAYRHVSDGSQVRVFPLTETIMGNAIPFIRHAFTTLLDDIRQLQALDARIEAQPGLPVENPTRSFWMSPLSPIAHHSSDLPQHADIVVIGSGITGTSVARTLLDRAHAQGKHPVVLMLEARDACSGATGRYVYTLLR